MTQRRKVAIAGEVRHPLPFSFSAVGPVWSTGPPFCEGVVYDVYAISNHFTKPCSQLQEQTHM